MFGREAANTNFMDYGFWFDPTGDRTHDLPINLKSSTLYRYTTQAVGKPSKISNCFKTFAI